MRINAPAGIAEAFLLSTGEAVAIATVSTVADCIPVIGCVTGGYVIASGCSRRIRIGELDDIDHRFRKAGIVWEFPNGCHCNVESAAWISPTRLGPAAVIVTNTGFPPAMGVSWLTSPLQLNHPDES